MSLAQHVTATEGVDRGDPQLFDDEPGSSEPRWRRLSFDAFAPIDHSAFPEADPAPQIAAYKISPARRIGTSSFPRYLGSLWQTLQSLATGIADAESQLKSFLLFLSVVSPRASSLASPL
jgi:hypothetical protein